MFKRVFLNHWIDWAIAFIFMAFIVVIGAVQQYSIEQDYSFSGDNFYYTIKIHRRLAKTGNRTPADPHQLEIKAN